MERPRAESGPAGHHGHPTTQPPGPFEETAKRTPRIEQSIARRKVNGAIPCESNNREKEGERRDTLLGLVSLMEA